jgi:tRNA threonylcarbamoyl adenosine modification protein YeaZ
MKILAIEFSSDQRSVALVEGDRVLGTAVESATRSTPAMELISRALAEGRIEREDIGCLAVGIGPGSYTGIRAAIAIAQGWQLALGQDHLQLLGIDSATCLAEEARQKQWSGKLNIVIDAQREELYLARYEVGAANVRQIAPLRLAPIQEARSLAAGEMIAGPEATKWFADGRILFPGAATLGRLASRRSDYVPGQKLEPIYLRETSFVKAPPPRTFS